jgi:hypothetical protein
VNHREHPRLLDEGVVFDLTRSPCSPSTAAISDVVRSAGSTVTSRSAVARDPMKDGGLRSEYVPAKPELLEGQRQARKCFIEL